MNFSRKFPHLGSAKFAPFAIFFLFLLANSTGVYFIPPLDASAVANSAPAQRIPADIPSSGNAELDWIIFRAGAREGVDPRFIHAVIWQESRYKLDALSHAGAQGLMQLMPATAKRFGCLDPHDMEENVAAGTKYLAWLLKRFNGDVKLALAGYNAGEGAVDRYHGIPPYNETQNYVRKIAANYGKTFHPIVTPAEARELFRLSTE
jgi:soluble lytic murein transglycosylase-like protein